MVKYNDIINFIGFCRILGLNFVVLPYKWKCYNVCISIGDYSFLSNMFSMPLGGCDVILGTQWLRTLGPILWNFVEEKTHIEGLTTRVS